MRPTVRCANALLVDPRAVARRVGPNQMSTTARGGAKSDEHTHVKANKNRTTFLAFCRYLRLLCPPEVRIAIVMDNYSPHLSTNKDSRVGDWAAANNVELAYVPTNASFLNRIECHFAPLRYFALDGTDHRDHNEQNSMIRRYIAWRNRHIDNADLRAISIRAKVA